MTDKLLTVEEAAGRLGTSVRFVRRLIAERRIAYIKVGRHVRIAEDDDQVVIVASWVYVGKGYETEGERWLALSAAARAREQRRMAWEELRTTAA